MIVPILAAVLLLAAAPQEKDAKVNPHEAQEKIDPARMYTYERQDVALPDFPAQGWILDIGGGGEGVIGRLKGKQVVAIDLYAWGMSRTPPGPLKLVMDATDLKFLDGSFGTVTSFFTLMYIPPALHEKAIREAYRVLEPDGLMRIWDVELPVAPNAKQDLAIYKFRFLLPAETIETGYGTSFPTQPLDSAYYAKLAKATGFAIEEQAAAGRTFRMVLRKPAPAATAAAGSRLP